MLRHLLVFLAGALVGANAVYYLMTLNDARPADAITIERAPTPDSGPAIVPSSNAPRAESPTTDSPATPVPAAPAESAAAPRAVPVPPPVVPAPSGLIVPVMGIAATQLSNTFDDARGSERVHEALDIMAPRGTPVLAVADGHVEKLFDSKQGGLTIYQFDPSGKLAYYYAHLDRYAPDLAEGRKLRQGEVIGYVGSTGNADPAAPHLHFAVFVLGPEKQWSKGTPINPYPLLGGR